MKKTLLLAAAALVVSVTAFAAPPKTKTVKTAAVPAKIKCAVMPGRMVDTKMATSHKMFADYKGNRYFFCCGGCPGMFKADPAKYAKATHIPTPKNVKKA